MGKIYGYKRWYEVEKEIENKKGEKKKIKVKVRVKREHNGEKYVIKRLDNNEIVGNYKFVKNLIKNKQENDTDKKFQNKFHVGNILFKLKLLEGVRNAKNKENLEISEEIIKEIEILSRTKELSEKIIRKNLLTELIQQLKNGNLKKESKEIKIKIKNEETEKYEYEKIKIEYNKTKDFNRDREGYILSWKKVDENERKSKIEVYDKLKNINEKLYILVKKISIKESKNLDNLKKRNYREYMKILLLKKEDTYNEMIGYINEIKDKFSNNKEYSIDKFLEFYSSIGGDKVSENKKIFVNKILYYIRDNTELTNEDIVDYIIGELEHWEIIKRVEKQKEKIESSQIKTYIEYDKHEKFKEEEKRNQKNNIVKLFIKDIENQTIKKEIKKVLEEFKISELIKVLKGNIQENIKDKDIFDTEIFGTYKKHYQKIFEKEKSKFKNISCSEKELYKIAYRYIKGRIEKILVNKEKIKTKKMFIEEVLDFDLLLTKIEKRVKQYTLEHIMYLGKIKHNNIDETTVNTKDFTKLHAKEELDLELITFFSAINMELNKIIGTIKKNEIENKIIDFFGEDLREKNFYFKNKYSNFKLYLLNELDFLGEWNYENNRYENIRKRNEENKYEKSTFHDFLEKSYYLRNKILHGSSKKNIKIINENNFKDEYKKVKEIIKKLRISDEEISKSLNLDVVFEGKNKKEIIEKIKNITINDKNKSIKKYLPSSSKTISKIRKEFIERNSGKNFDKESEDIILNSVFYLSKILYEKLTLNDEFINNLTKKLNENFKKNKKIQKNQENSKDLSIEEHYKNAQILAAKGNKKSIFNYQEKIIEFYIEYCFKNKKYIEIINFEKFNKNIEQIKQEIKDRKDKESEIKNNSESNDSESNDSENNDIEIKNDFEYVISIFALLSNNIFLNKIRNRFFSTLSWIGENNSIVDFSYENIINILDEIININTLRAEDINNNWEYDLEKHITEYENNLKKLENTQGIFCKNKDYIIKEILKDEILKNDPVISNIMTKEKDKFKMDEKGRAYFELSKDKRASIGEKIPKIRLIVNKYISDKKVEISNNIFKKYYNSDILKKYKKILNNLIDKNLLNEKKFENIFYQTESENNKNSKKLYIYKKNLFENIGNSNFDKIYNLFKEDIQKVKTEILFDDEIRNSGKDNIITKINNILNKLNNDLKGYSKNYKEKYRNNIKNNKFISYKNKNDFMKDYEKVSIYKHNRDLVEFNYLNKLNHYLIDINWKLAIQMARFERDIHYIVNGLESLGVAVIEKNEDNTLKTREGRSMAYNKYENNNLKETSYYCFCDYKKFEDICYSLGIDLTANSEVQKPEKESIRNYISHFYIVRELFNGFSIAEQIDRVSNLLSYSTKYNNSTYLSVFEVFKKDVNLEYDVLKGKIKLSEVGDNEATKKEIKELISPKKVSVLELEHYNSEYVIELIEKLLTTKRS